MPGAAPVWPVDEINVRKKIIEDAGLPKRRSGYSAIEKLKGLQTVE